MFPFDCAGFILWTYRLSPLFQLNFFFAFSETPSPQRNDNERSPSQRRALVNATPSARQLVEPSARRKPIQRTCSVNPHKPPSSPPTPPRGRKEREERRVKGEALRVEREAMLSEWHFSLFTFHFSLSSPRGGREGASLSQSDVFYYLLPFILDWFLIV